MESNEAMNDFILFTKKTNRYLLIILTVLLCFTLVSCGNTDSRFDEAKIPLGLNVQDNRNYPSTSVQEDGERGTVAISTDNPPETTTATTPLSSTSISTETETPTETTQDQHVVPPANSTFSVKFIDVGQADAALIECDGHYMLIDGGSKIDSSRMYTILKNTGVTNLDIVVGSHAHEDHIGGLPGALNYATADLILCPVTSYDTKAFRDFVKYANLKGNGIVVPRIEQSIRLEAQR